MSAANDEPSVLVVDDEVVFARAIAKRLGREGYRVQSAHSLEEARDALDAGPIDLILLDVRLPDGSGQEFLLELRRRGQRHGQRLPAVVMMTAFSEIDDAINAMKNGALDYLRKPIDLDRITTVVDTTLDARERTAHATQERPANRAASSENRTLENHAVLGQSDSIESIRQQIERIGQLTTRGDRAPTVLILGETGTGKDVAARSLHAHSTRAERPFVHVDCAALPADLIESELFGHEKGAFTGAQNARVGLLEAAGNGTVFLDEVGELSLSLQTKLLAVLERRMLRRLGSSVERSLAAWFIAATNRDLKAMVDAGDFRADLYFRLKILTVELPPLRARCGDASLLAAHYASLSARRYGLDTPTLSPAAIDALDRHPWPGNIRELVHMIERAVVLSGGATIDTCDLGLETPGTIEPEPPIASRAASAPTTLESAESQLIREALEHAQWNVSRAARALGVTRMTLRYRMQKHGIER